MFVSVEMTNSWEHFCSLLFEVCDTEAAVAVDDDEDETHSPQRSLLGFQDSLAPLTVMLERDFFGVLEVQVLAATGKCSKGDSEWDACGAPTDVVVARCFSE
jgi:hypothetical protein